MPRAPGRIARRNGGNRVDPQGEQAEPGEELDDGKPAHHRGHERDILDQQQQSANRPPGKSSCPDPFDRGAVAGRDQRQQVDLRAQAEGKGQGREHGAEQHESDALGGRWGWAVRVVGCVGLRPQLRCGRVRSEQRRQCRNQHQPCSERKGGADRCGQHSGRRGSGNSERMAEQPRQGRSQNRAAADQDDLDGKAGRAPVRGKDVGEQCAQGLHRDVRRGVSSHKPATAAASVCAKPSASMPRLVNSAPIAMNGRRRPNRLRLGR